MPIVVHWWDFWPVFLGQELQAPVMRIRACTPGAVVCLESDFPAVVDAVRASKDGSLRASVNVQCMVGSNWLEKACLLLDFYLATDRSCLKTKHETQSV